MQALRNLAAVAILRGRTEGCKDEMKEQSGGGFDAQPLCKFAMLKTVSSTAPREAVSGGDGSRGGIGRAGATVLTQCAATTPAGGAILAM